jgi:hypothetical protein
MQRFGGAASTTIFLNESGPGCDKFCEVYGRVALPRDRCRSAYRFEIVVRHRIGGALLATPRSCKQLRSRRPSACMPHSSYRSVAPSELKPPIDLLAERRN